LSAVTVFFLLNQRKTKAKQSLGKRLILPEAPFPGKQYRALQSTSQAHPDGVRSARESAKV
jgi:hypothetical protein